MAGRGAGGDDADPQLPEFCSPVKVVSQAGKLICTRAFHEQLSSPGLERVDIPVILQHAPLARPRLDGAERTFKDFAVARLERELGDRKLPSKSERDAGSNCLFVGDQGNSDVIEGEATCWHPRYRQFRALTQLIQSGSSSLYLRLSSANGACRRDNKAYKLVELKEAACPDLSGGILKDFIDRAPIPCITPFGLDFTMVFWMGSEGKSFGLHSDLFCEQYILQNEGVKEVYLMLPEDPTAVEPIPFITSVKHYKSSIRTVKRMDLEGRGCLWGVLHPGDVLYIPPMWWHEFRTVSTGPSLSTTIRVHLDLDKAFYGVVRNFRSLHEQLVSRGSDRLTKHTCLYFIRGIFLGLPVAAEGYYAGMLQRMFGTEAKEKAAVGDEKQGSEAPPDEGKALPVEGQALPVEGQAVPEEDRVQAEEGQAAPATLKKAAGDAGHSDEAPVDEGQELPTTPSKAPESDDGGSTAATRQLSVEPPLDGGNESAEATPPESPGAETPPPSGRGGAALAAPTPPKGGKDLAIDTSCRTSCTPPELPGRCQEPARVLEDRSGGPHCRAATLREQGTQTDIQGLSKPTGQAGHRSPVGSPAGAAQLGASCHLPASDVMTAALVATCSAAFIFGLSAGRRLSS